MKKKYIEADTRLPGEKKESKILRWLSDTKIAILIQVKIWQIQEYLKK